MPGSEKFRFETVHRVRRLQEKQKQRELGALIVQLERTIAHRGQIQSERFLQATRLAGLDEMVSKPVWAQTIAARMAFLNDLIERDFELEADTRLLIEEKRKEVKKALQERKMFDRLYEKHRDNLQRERRSREIKELDEIAVMRFSKRVEQEPISGEEER